MQEQTPKQIYIVRTKFYNLLTNCIPAEEILKCLTLQLFNLDSQLQHVVIHWSAFYEHRIKTGTRPIFHLEAFIAKYMSSYKNSQLSYDE
jgi:replication factor C subunit 3/5